jgi:Kef-type K+ transport system membrane component KefB
MGHHDIPLFLLHVSLLLIAARVLGEISRKCGQPAVIGELVAGIVLGKSGLGLLGISFFYSLPDGIQGPLQTVSLLGVLLLLLLTGLETDFALIRRNAGAALAVSLGGLCFPLLCGVVFGYFVPAHYVPQSRAGELFPAFMAVCMGISALPVIGKVLIELKVTRLGISQTLIASAMLEDATGWLILSIILALLGGAELSAYTVAESFLTVVGCVALAFTIGKTALRKIFDIIQVHFPGPEATLSIIVAFMLLLGSWTQYLGLEAIFGAFIFGMLLSALRKGNDEAIHSLHLFTLNVFAPLFFAMSGLNVSILGAFQEGAHWLTLSIIAVAIFCKLVGGYVGARFFAGYPHRTALFFGIGLNARGSMEVIVASIGLKAGVLTPEIFSAIVLMAIVTSLIAPPGLRWVVSKLDLSEEEQERLAREEMKKESLTANVDRILIPIRTRSTEELSSIHALEAAITERLEQASDVALTLLSIVPPGDEARASRYLDMVAQLFSQKRISKKVVVGTKPGDVIINEVSKGYDLLLLGTPHSSLESHPTNKEANSVFTDLIDFVVHKATCPVVLVQSTKNSLLPSKGAKIVVPTNGSPASQRAADFAFQMAASYQAEVHLIKVIEVSNTWSSAESLSRQRSFGASHTEYLQRVAGLMGAVAISSIEEHEAPEDAILEKVRALGAHLLVLGTGTRSGAEKLFLGPRVERVLAHSPCPVVVIAG